MCGEHAACSVVSFARGGSSPRVRGTHRRMRLGHPRMGIIPACAGNTSHPSTPSWIRRDHPRVCGEHMTMATLLNVSAGSSPRVRGTPVLQLRRAGRRGIIPACAGNTLWAARPAPARRDHPRVCGEHVRAALRGYRPPGSSPRVRGTLETFGASAVTSGIIPACAGNTGDGLVQMVGVQGSSPRVRGTPASVQCSRQCRGIIPACAGNTRRTEATAPSSRDHPRVCGEHQKNGADDLSEKGSSPRVRGTPFGSNGLSIDRGIIPACAGNTVRGWKFRRSKGDHPRVCGEHCVLIGNTDMASGSSPRVRGTPGRRLSSCRQRGIIPACAGNTIESSLPSNIPWDHPRVCGEHLIEYPARP